MEGSDPSIIRSRDIISLQIDSLGILATPSFHEPLPERDEVVSHLRLIPIPSDFSAMDFTRCMFRVETEMGQVRVAHCRYREH